MITEFLRRREAKKLDEEMLDFYRRSLAGLPIIDGTPKAPTVEVEHRFVTTRRIEEGPEEPKPQTLNDNVLGPPKPAIKSVNPDNGSLGGGSYVEITGEPGTVFLNSGEVRFDNLLATDFHWYGNELISCKTPAHVAAPLGVDVDVYNIPGNDASKGTKIKGFRYFSAPYITSIGIISTNPGDPNAAYYLEVYGGQFYYPTNTQLIVNGQVHTALTMLDFHESTRDFHRIEKIIAGPRPATLQIEVVNPDTEHQRSGQVTYESILGYQISGPTQTTAFVFYNYTITAVRSDNTFSTTFNGNAKLAVYLAFFSVITGQNSISNVTWTPLTIPIVNGVGHFSMRSNPNPAPTLGGPATSGDFYVTAVDQSFNPPPNYTGFGYIQIHVTQLS